MSGPYQHVSRLLYRREWFEAGLTVARWVPRSCLRFLAGWGGRLYARTHPARARVAVANVRAVVPDSPVRAEAIYGHFARMLADYFHVGARGNEAIRRITGRRIGYAHLQKAREDGRGAVLATLHLGFFELGGWVLSELGIPTLALTRPEPDPALTAWRAAYRRRWDMETLEVGQDPFALLEALKALREGRMVAALVDRPHPQQRLATTIDGIPLWCSRAILQLAAKARAPVLPLVVYCNAAGIYEFEVMEAVEVDPQRLEEAATHIWSRLLPVVRRHPDQYFQFEEMSA